VNVFAERIDAQHPESDVDRRLRRPRRHVRGEETIQHVHGPRAKPIALDDEPALEGLAHALEPLEEVAPIECGGASEIVRRRARREPREVFEIDRDELGIEADGLPGDERSRAERRSESVAENGQGLTQAVTGALRLGVRPQDRHQFLARLGLAHPRPEIGEQRPRLAAADRDRYAAGAGAERSKEGETE